MEGKKRTPKIYERQLGVGKEIEINVAQIIMNTSIKDLSIITITFNNQLELIKTYQSLNQFRNSGGTHIVVNGGHSVSDIVNKTILIEEPDNGIYDAINKGISRVSTPFFMLVHSGDVLVENIKNLEVLLKTMVDNDLDFMLNDCSLDFGKRKRIMKSSKWHPWMLKLGAQPPHPPTIYKTSSVKRYKYDMNHPIIADFKYLEELIFSDLKWDKGNRLIVHMADGGATSSGLKSFFFVNRQFKKLKGTVTMFWFALARPIIKLYQMM